MTVGDVVRAMQAAGCTADQIVAAIGELDKIRLGKNAARQRRFRERRNESDVTGVTRNESDVTPLKKETFPPTPPLLEKNSPPPSLRSGPPLASLGVPPKPVTPPPTPRQILLECLSPEMADAVLAHRRAKKCPLTVRAAQLLAKGFTATGDPAAAADMMIERGWQGFKPEWFDNERASNGRRTGNGSGSGKGSLVEAGRRLTERIDAAERERELRAANSIDPGNPVVRLLPGLGSKRS
jgi:hypothetical protein